MKNEKYLNRIIWTATVLFFVFAIILEFRIDKLIVKCLCACLGGHREFFINIMLGGFASGIITGITTWIAFMTKKQSIEERANRYLHDVRRYFKEYCNSIYEKDYKSAISALEKFENSMTDFNSCIHSNNYANKKYTYIEEIHWKKISWSTTRLLNYNCIFTNEEGNINLLFDDLSKHMKSGVEDEFSKALADVLGEDNARIAGIYDPIFEKQYREIKERYSLDNDNKS